MSNEQRADWHSTLDEVLTKSPVNIVILYETPKEFDFAAPARSTSAMQGLVAFFHQIFNEED